jgi:LysR family carnitine catabolism transcriptional activator
MEIRALRTFAAVAETLSFTHAGRRLNISQSAVSQQIRALEQAAGTPLFVRHARTVALTQAGNVLLPYARQIVAKADEATAVVSDFENLGRGRIVIGAGGAICHHVLPQILREFTTRFAKIELQVISGFTFETLARAGDGTIDMGILLLPVRETNLVAAEIGRDQLVAIAPRGHRWAELDRVRAADFQDEKLITYDRKSRTFRILEQFLLEAGVFPSFGMEISDLEAVKKMVEVGLGVAVLAGWAVRTEVAAGTLVARPLGTAGLYRSWGLIHRANEVLTAAQRALMGICKGSFPQLVSTPID